MQQFQRLINTRSLLSVIVLALTAPLASANSAVEPVARKDAYAIERHEEFLRRARQGGVDVLFLGDSITEQWEMEANKGVADTAIVPRGKPIWEREFLPMRAANFSISGARTEQLLWRLQHGELEGIEPRVVVMMIGEANARPRSEGGGGNTAPEIFAGIAALVNELRARLPQTHILLQGLFPLGPRDGQTRTVIAAVNRSLPQLDDGRWVHFINFGSRFLQTDGEISRALLPDECHPSRLAFEIWAAEIKGPLVDLLKGPGVTSLAGPPADATEATLFAIDNHSMPYLRNLYLTMHAVEKEPHNPVVRRGGPGSPDEYAAQFYGSVIRMDGKFRMWYLAGTPEVVLSQSASPQSFRGYRVCYAESQDGISWVKPNLGLVEFNGSTRNNIVRLAPFGGGQGNAPGPGNVLVLHEPDDPVPSHRFKMMLLIEPRVGANLNSILPFYSADGLSWSPAVPGEIDVNGMLDPKAAILPLDHFEIGGLFRFQGAYYATGQQVSPYSWLPDGAPVGRSLSTFRSPDFERWSPARSQGFVRWGYQSARISQAHEVHMPVATWNRGNVLVGVYGQFQGSPDSHLHPLDLGLLVSNDGIHFREPINDRVFLPHDPQSRWESGGVVQGQGFVNVGDRTFIYYGGWDGDVENANTRSEIGLATLRRDGFGSLSLMRPGLDTFLVTCALANRGPTGVWINADGLTDGARLRVELLDESGELLVGFSGLDAVEISRPGTRVPVTWKQGSSFDLHSNSFRLRVTFEGPDSAQIKLYALYVGIVDERRN